jgi:hypothetical protein
MSTIVKFREAPIGEVTLDGEGTKLVRVKPEPGQVVKLIPKMVFTSDPIRKFGDRGQWWEIRVEEFLNGELCLLGMGFTGTDPETLVDTTLPGRASAIPLTYIVGYNRAVHWNGERLNAETVWSKVKPFKIFSIGVLATPSGSMEVYFNRCKVFDFDPIDKGLPPMDTSKPLWGVVDTCGGLKKATLLVSSAPPTEDEANDGAGAPP